MLHKRHKNHPSPQIIRCQTDTLEGAFTSTVLTQTPQPCHYTYPLAAFSVTFQLITVFLFNRRML